MLPVFTVYTTDAGGERHGVTSSSTWYGPSATKSTAQPATLAAYGGKLVRRAETLEGEGP
jgi:hypothetical protein